MEPLRSTGLHVGGNYYETVKASGNSQVHQGNVYYTDKAQLKYVEGAAYDVKDQVPRACHPGTRKDLLQNIRDWAQRPDSKQIFWLNGMAGTGKSTISYTVANWLAEQPSDYLQLGASFFFKRGEGDRASAALFFPTIVRQLMLRVSGLDLLVGKVIDADPDICSKSLSDQFDKLLRKPLQKLDITARHMIYVIVVDALDECGNENDVSTMLRLWSSLTHFNNVLLRLFLTSRPEMPIRLGFTRMSTDMYQDIVLHEVPLPVIQHDILTFLQDEFAKIRERYNDAFPRSTPLNHAWPGEDILHILTNMAAPLFIAAVTLCRFVQDLKFDPRRRLDIVLTSQGSRRLSKVGQMYYPVLTQMLASVDDIAEEAEICKGFQLVVGSIVILTEPLSMKDLASLLDVDLHTVEVRLSPLHSVLRIPPDSDAPVRPLHLSFNEYLCGKELDDQRFHINRTRAHEVLLRQCLQLLAGSNGLRENICRLNFPGQSRSEVSPATIDKYISPSVRYACRYWPRHARYSQNKISDDDKVHEFLQTCFLQWVEALSLLGHLAKALSCVEILWSVISPHKSTSVTSFLEDARQFLLTNRHIIQLAPVQVYSLAILFTPQTSIVEKVHGKVLGWSGQCSIMTTTHNLGLQKCRGQVELVRMVVFSPDGSALASISDLTIRLWDASTGQEIQILKGHTRFINTVAFSPDGSVLASGSNDQTVRLWDTSTGREVRRLDNYSEIDKLSFTADGNGLLTNQGYIPIHTTSTVLEPPHSYYSGFILIKNDWLEYRGQKIIWLPKEYRHKASATHGNTLAIGLRSGQVILVEILPEYL